MRVLNLRVWAVACLSTAAACSSSTSDLLYPDRKAATVTIASGTPGFSIERASNGYPIAHCTVSLTAIASGTVTASWGDAIFYFYTGLDRTKTSDTAVVSAADVATSWDHGDISSAEREQGGWEVSDALPFDLEIVFHYTVPWSRAVRSARTRFTCGPSVPSGSVAPPSLPQLALVPRAQWQPGDTLGMRFQASSPSGLWLTYATASGAFTADTLFTESLQPSTQRLVQMRIPAAATLGQPALASVYVMDAFGQHVAQSVPTSPVVDITPPELQLTMFSSYWRSFTTTLGGSYFVGDSVDFVPFASDNHALNAIVWHATPGTESDSILEHGAVGAGGLQVLVPVRSDWVGGVQFRFYAVDDAGNVGNTVTTPAGAFAVYPTMSRPTVTASVNGDVEQTLVDTARDAVYLLQMYKHSISVLSRSTLQPATPITFDSIPHSFDVTPGGDSLIVALGRTRLGVVDLRSPSAAPGIISLSIDTAAGQALRVLRVASNDRVFAVIGDSTTGGNQLLEVDLTTGIQRFRTDAGTPVMTVGRSLDQSVLTVARENCIELYDAATDAFGPCTVMTQYAALPSADRTGRRFAVQLTAFDSSLAPIRTVQTLWNLGSSAWLPTTISADGTYLYYYLYPEGVIRARVSDGAVLDRTIVPGFDAEAVSLSPDGKTMLFTENDPVTQLCHVAAIDVRDADAHPLQMARVPRSVPVLTPSPVRSSRVVAPLPTLPSPSDVLSHTGPVVRPWSPAAGARVAPSRSPR